MRDIEKKIIPAFMNNISLTLGNTQSTGKELLLHGNVIAKKVKADEYYKDNKDIAIQRDVKEVILITNAGWNINVTSSRLNALMQYVGSSSRIFKMNGWHTLGRTRSRKNDDFNNRWIPIVNRRHT